MANERLQAALIDSGRPLDEVARRVGVHPKTINRWVDGRRPHRRYQYALGNLLGADPAVLWPEPGAAVPNVPPGEVLPAPGEEMAEGAAIGRGEGSRRIPILANYAFSALAGTIWYFQFFFYSMGETQMGKYQFSSWTLHMASIIIFSTLWGIALKEWRGVGLRTRMLVVLGLAVLIGSTVVVGYGNYLAGFETHA